jgi:hypothetical protein
MIAVKGPEADFKSRTAAWYPLSALQSPSTHGPGSNPAPQYCAHACRRSWTPASLAAGNAGDLLMPQVEQMPSGNPYPMLLVDDNGGHVQGYSGAERHKGHPAAESSDEVNPPLDASCEHEAGYLMLAQSADRLAYFRIGRAFDRGEHQIIAPSLRRFFNADHHLRRTGVTDPRAHHANDV